MSWKTIITLFSLLAFFVGSTGIIVFEHHCSISGDFIGFYSDVNHDCGEETLEKSCKKESSKTCCQSQNEEDVPKFDEDCCTTNVSLVKIDSDYSLNNYEINLERNYPGDVYVYNYFYFLKELVQEEPRGPPDLRNPQSKRRSFIQVYLI